MQPQSPVKKLLTAPGRICWLTICEYGSTYHTSTTSSTVIHVAVSLHRAHAASDDAEPELVHPFTCLQHR